MRPQDISALPAVIDALVALGLSLPSVDVSDGPLGATTPASNDVLVVGVEPPTASAEAQQEPHGLGNRLTEHFMVRCRASSLSGDTDMKARRDRAYSIVADISAAVKADSTLGGVCDRAYVGPELQLWQGQTPAGAVAEISFDISGVAYL